MIKKRFLQWKEVLIAIKGLPEKKRYCQKICREVKLAKSHVRNIIPWLEYQGLIRISGAGKIKYIKLTRKGELVILDILKLKKDMKNGEL
jgi:predicted transcriptional regulator